MISDFVRKRNLRRYCSHCGRELTPTDKGRSHDFGLMEEKVGYPRPLCVDDAYFYASKYIEANLDRIPGNFNLINLRSNSS